MQRLVSFLKGPQGLLLATNVVCALLGLAQGLFAARLLGAASYGVIGVLQAFGALASNFWDVRLIDLSTKLHFTLRENTKKQTGNMVLSLAFNAGLAVLIALSTFCLCLFLSRFFVDAPVGWGWCLAQSLIIASSFVLGSVQVFVRLSNSFGLFSGLRIFSQILILALMLVFLEESPSLNGYYWALSLSSGVGLVASVLALLSAWKKQIGSLHFQLNDIWPHYKAEMKFIISANFMSYSKMLARGGDILVFNYFASDQAAGVYRLARSLTDNLSVFSMSLSQYYFPWFLDHLHAKKNELVKRAIRYFTFGTGLAMVGLIPATYIALYLLNTYFLHGAYPHLELSACIMVIGFFWPCGIHMWLWPVLMHAKQTHRMAFWTTAGSIAQLALMAALCHTFGAAPEYAAACVLVYYLVAYTPLLMWWRGHQQKAGLAAL